jgi:hypothetical protein
MSIPSPIIAAIVMKSNMHLLSRVGMAGWPRGVINAVGRKRFVHAINGKRFSRPGGSVGKCTYSSEVLHPKSNKERAQSGA